MIWPPEVRLYGGTAEAVRSLGELSDGLDIHSVIIVNVTRVRRV